MVRAGLKTAEKTPTPPLPRKGGVPAPAARIPLCGPAKIGQALGCPLSQGCGKKLKDLWGAGGVRV